MVAATRTPGSAPQVRRFRLCDLAAILQIERSSFRREAYPRELFLAYHRRCPDLFLVATAGGEVAGYSITCVEGERAELISIAVGAAFRRSGSGRALLLSTLRRLRRRSVRRLGLMVKVTNRKAIRFYDALGFRRVRLVREYYEDGADGYLMTRDLF